MAIIVNPEDRVGEVRYNKFGSKMILKAWRKRKDVDVYFPEYNWIYYNANYSNFDKGALACPYEPRVFGIGYIGEGKYKMKKGYTTNETYVAWKGILERCYDSNNRRTYGSKVIEGWLCFNKFAEWFDDNIYHVEGQRMCVDKDILIKGNKLYSPETCCIVPNDLNVLFTNSKASRGKYLLGVDFHKKTGKYRARCTIFNESVIIGSYDTEMEAFLNYKKVKENHIKEMADMYKGIIPNNVYEALYNWKIDIDD